MIKAVQLTENSWILYNRTEKYGLMRRVDQDGYGIIGGPFPGEYKSLEELEKKVGGGSFKFLKSKAMKNVIENFVHGYPVKHEEVFDVDADGNYPVYTKKKSSNDLYAAGYWCFQFKGKWQGSYCPRVKTVEEYPNVGPFKTKIEMDHTVKVENNKDGSN